MFGYSLLRLNQSKDYVNALFDELGAFGVPIEGFHTETGPGGDGSRDPVRGRAGSRGPRRALQVIREGDWSPLRDHAFVHGEVAQ